MRARLVDFITGGHRGPGLGRRGRGLLSVGLSVLFVVVPGASGPAADSPTETGSNSLRIGFASNMFTEVNESDARASVKVWAATIAKERGIDVDPVPQIFKRGEDLVQALLNAELDVAGLTTTEYLRLESTVSWGSLFVTITGGTISENYVLLVHKDSEIESIGALRDRELLCLANVRTCLALPWLEILLADGGLGPPDDFLGKMTGSPKLATAVLPVFFRQADACLVTLKGLETMTELNPQIGRELRILATSPEVVPAIFAFRRDYDSPAREDVFSGLRELHHSPAGRQVLTVFQSERLVDMSGSALDSARRIFGGHANSIREMKNTGGGRAAAPSAAEPGGKR